MEHLNMLYPPCNKRNLLQNLKILYLLYFPQISLSTQMTYNTKVESIIKYLFCKFSLVKDYWQSIGIYFENHEKNKSLKYLDYLNNISDIKPEI